MNCCETCIKNNILLRCTLRCIFFYFVAIILRDIMEETYLITGLIKIKYLLKILDFMYNYVNIKYVLEN